MEENKPIHNEKGKSPPSTDDSPQPNAQLNTSSTDETIVRAAETSTEVEHSEIPPSSGTEQPQTINYKPETEDMEVHHHTHHEHGKRNWKSYFWEFLMLFLAVFCGFLAEYQLEHKIERDREKQFIKSFIEDLKTDSVRIARIIELNTQQVAGFDSLLQNIYQKPRTDSSIKSLYYLQRKYTININRLVFSKSTIAQLKNAGGFRLIRKKNAIDSIVRYDITCEMVENQAEGVDYSGKLIFELSAKLFDGEYLLNYTGSKLNDFLISDVKPTLLTNEETVIKEYANLAIFKRGAINFYITYLKNLQSRIPGTIQFLEKQYHLE